MAEIYSDPRSFLKEFGHGKCIVMTSGGFDPLHVGHLRCILGAVEIAQERFRLSGIEHKVVVVVNGDGFLMRKKGMSFMPHEERMEMVAGIRGVDAVVGWDDGTQTVKGCIKALRPKVFAKGGDRSAREFIPEADICDEVECEIIFGVGGALKIQSSSNLINNKEVDMASGDKVTFKPWGYEVLLIKTGVYAAKILNIDSNKRLSRQYHPVKDETIHVLSGILTVELGPDGDDVRTMRPGDTLHVEPGTVHRFCATTSSVKLFEVSTPELDDLVRISDDFGR